MALYHSFNFETLSHSIALRSELVVHGYPGLSWTWGALALSCLVCAGLGRLRFGVPKPGLGVPRSVLDMGFKGLILIWRSLSADYDLVSR